MLKIFLEEIPDAVYQPPVYFDDQYKDEWITDPLSVSQTIFSADVNLVLKQDAEAMRKGSTKVLRLFRKKDGDDNLLKINRHRL